MELLPREEWENYVILGTGAAMGRTLEVNSFCTRMASD